MPTSIRIGWVRKSTLIPGDRARVYVLTGGVEYSSVKTRTAVKAFGQKHRQQFLWSSPVVTEVNSVEFKRVALVVDELDDFGLGAVLAGTSYAVRLIGERQNNVVPVTELFPDSAIETPRLAGVWIGSAVAQHHGSHISRED